MSQHTSVPDPQLYVFDLVERLQNSLIPFTFSRDGGSVTALPTKPQDQLSTENVKSLSEPERGHFCSYCGPIAQIEQSIQSHYKADYHRYNIKRKLHGQSPLTEEEFDRVIGELDDSISGSDESDEGSLDEAEKDTDTLATLMNSTGLLDPISEEQYDEPVNLNHTPYFMYLSKDLPENRVYAFYKSIFDTKFTGNEYRTPEEDGKNSMDALSGLKPNGTSVILMLGGGHFSGAIISHKRISKQKPTFQNPFADIEVVASKSFHRYTVRKKQGGSQSASDSAKGKANSAGSSLRRANEAALEKDIRELLDSWKEALKDVSAIYIRANGPANRKILMNYPNGPIVHTDARIKSLPFSTRRATAAEVKRAWAELSHVKVEDKPIIQKQEAKQAAQNKKIASPAVAAKSKEVDPLEVHTKEVTGLIKKSKIAGLITYFKKSKLSPDFELSPIGTYSHTPTCLHFAASKGAASMVTALLKSLRANPCLTNNAGKTAYQISADRATRDAFQLARTALGEETWNWDTDAHVGRALTDKDITARLAKEKVETANENEQKIQEMEEAERKRQEARMDKKFSVGGGKKLSSSVAVSVSGNGAGLLEMTADERMRLERERRARAVEARLGLKK